MEVGTNKNPLPPPWPPLPVPHGGGGAGRCRCSSAFTPLQLVLKRQVNRTIIYDRLRLFFFFVPFFFFASIFFFGCRHSRPRTLDTLCRLAGRRLLSRLHFGTFRSNAMPLNLDGLPAACLLSDAAAVGKCNQAAHLITSAFLPGINHCLAPMKRDWARGPRPARHFGERRCSWWVALELRLWCGGV